MRKATLLGIMFAFTILGLGIFVSKLQWHTSTAQLTETAPLAATVFSEPRHFPSFILTDQNKQVFTNSNLLNHWSLVFFGFTHCKGICPTTLAELAKVFRMLPPVIKQANPQVIFVTVDPDYDSPQQLKEYLNSFNAEFIGLTGESNSLSKLRRQLGILAMMNDPRDQAASNLNYDKIDHSGTILLVNPKGQYVGVFSMPHDAQAIVADLKQLIEPHKVV